MDFVNLFIINKLSSKNGSENSVCKWYRNPQSLFRICG